MLGEFFAAGSGDIDAALVQSGPFERFRTVEAKGLTEVSLATLGEILGAGAYEELADRLAEGPQIDSGEAGLFVLPDAFRDALASPQNVERTAQDWAATEELAADSWGAEDASAVLRDLAELAGEARSKGHQLLYWWSV